MKLRTVVLFLVFFVFLSGSLVAYDEFLHTVDSRSDVKQKFILIKPANPTAAVILFAGGHGALELDSSSSGGIEMGWGAGNFLVRTRNLFADHGFIVAVTDRPSDREKMSALWRMGKKHAKEILSIIHQIKKGADVPIWVVGTSMGTFSAANAAILLKSEVDGLVLTSTITRSRQRWKIYSAYPNAVIDMDLEGISIPTLIASHESDGCRITPASDAKQLKEKLKNSKHVEVVLFRGGDPPESGPCQGRSDHGFFGIEKQVVNTIAEFIKNN